MNPLKYKDLVFNLVERDLKLKYKGSSIGFLWSLVNPFFMLLVYTIVFKTILKSDIPNFTLFLMSGLFPWNFFSAGITSSLGCMTGNASLLTKVKIPGYILVLSSLLFQFVIFLMIVVLMLVAIPLFGLSYTSVLWYLPLAIILQLLFMYSLGVILSISNVYFHDTAHLIELVIMAWFWLTPVIYQFDMVPENLQAIMQYNPMVIIINLYQHAIVGTPLYINPMIGILGIFITLIISIAIYIKFNKKIPELV